MIELEKDIEHYKSLVKDSLNEIYMFDAVSYKFIYLNKSAQINLGYTFEEMNELTPVDIKPDLDIHSFDKLLMPLRDKKKTKAQFQTNHQRKDGTLYPVEVHLQLSPNDENQYFSAFILDITERRKIEFDLLESYKIINSSPITVFLWGNQEHWDTKFVSNNVYSLLGYTSEEFLKNKISFKDVIHPEDFDRVNKKLFNYYKLKQNKKLILEYRVITKDGTIKWVRDFPSIRKDSTKTISHFHGVLQDITEEILAEKLLQKSEKKFKDLFKKSSDALLIIKNSIFTDCNDATCKMLGYSSKNEFLNVHPSKLSPIVQPDGKNSFEKAEEMMSITFEKGSYRFEWIHTKKNGEDFPVEVLLTLISKEPDNKTIYCVWRDITKRKLDELILKESEQNLLAAQEIANLGSFTLDFNTKIIKSSSVFDAITNITSTDNKNHEYYRSIIHPDDLPLNDKLFSDCIKTGQQYSSTYRILIKETNETRWIIEKGRINYKNGEPISFSGTIQDITAQKRNELNLQNAYTEVEQLKNQLETENISLKDEISLAFNYEDLVYSSLEISNVLTQVEQVSDTNATVLILGETGTGKELIARAIHNTSNRKNKSLIKVNCAAIPTELIESELFGHVKGSFTGAIKNRIGKFQLADGGTLFLDEIGEMPLELQPKLLRAIQEGEIEPIGSSKLIKLDVRIIAATNKELEKEVEDKQFRQDLFFRLNVFPITVPPLRNRIDDIPVLVHHFLDKYCKKYDKKIESISNETLQQMKIYSWPGNIRELENLVERAVITSSQDQLIFKEFDNPITQNKSLISSHITLEDAQSNHIIKTLNLTQWKIDGKEGAAVLLDIKPSTLRDRMKKFGIKRPKT